MSPELNTALSLCRNLPSPAGVAVRIIELAQDPETDIATAADVISMDMALSARMMRIANSPLYASRRRIDNLGQALTMLGLHATLQLALGFSLANVLDGNGRNPKLLERLWRRSALCALASRFLGMGCGVKPTLPCLKAPPTTTTCSCANAPCSIAAMPTSVRT
jgi:HD-like signal output (HDOD) protein